LDATIIESWKREARLTYQGISGYQPMLALWAEMDLAVADEFRDGNVPAQMAPLPVTKRAFQALPSTVKEFYFRGDSACWEGELLKWLRDEQRSAGPQGPITFGISVRMTPNLKKHMQQLGKTQWKPYHQTADMDCECADLLNYWPEETDRPAGAGPSRYIAIRMRKRQGELFADGNEEKYFAVASNQWEWDAVRLLEWQREKAGTIEALHDVLKNELAAGLMPCGRLGANAAAAGGDESQRADGAEAAGPAGEVAAGATQTSALPDLLFARQTGHACAADVAPREAAEGATGRVD